MRLHIFYYPSIFFFVALYFFYPPNVAPGGLEPPHVGSAGVRQAGAILVQNAAGLGFMLRANQDIT